jgi:phage terminase small subunit
MRHRELRFIDEYLVDADPTKAALRAGYTAKCARQVAARLLRQAPVRFAIGRRQAERAARFGLTRERVLLEYARIAFGNLGRIVRSDGDGLALAQADDLSDDDAAAIVGIVCAAKGGGVTRVRLHDKGAALEALGQYFGLFDGEPPQDATRGAHARLMALVERLARMG